MQPLLTFTNGTPAPSAHPPPASRTPVIPVSLFQIHYIAMLDGSRMSSSWLFALLRGSLRLPSPSELPSSCQDEADHLAVRPTRPGLSSAPPPPFPRFHHGLLFKISASACHGLSITTERAVFSLHILAESYFTGSQDFSAQKRQIPLSSLSFVRVTHSKKRRKPIPSEQHCSD